MSKESKEQEFEEVKDENISSEEYPAYRSLVKYFVYGSILFIFLWIFVSITIQVFKPELAPSRDSIESE